MESQPQNPEFRINPENFHSCTVKDSLFSLLNTIDKQKALRHDCIYNIEIVL